MREINFKKKDIQNLTVYNKGGFEGKIYIYSQDLLLKVFEEYLRGVLDFENKHYKLIKLNKLNISEDIMVKPLNIININGNFSGYMMPKIEDSITLNNIRDYKKLVKVYRKLFEHLEILHENQIIINDVKPENMLLRNNQNPVFIDIDSMGVGDLPPESINVNSYIAKSIPNIEEKIKNNSAYELDKLKLVASFLYTLKDNPAISITENLFNSKLSNDFKSYLATMLHHDGNLSEMLSSVKDYFLHEEMIEHFKRSRK